MSYDGIDRREALRRAALLLGGALSAETIAGVLAGCAARDTTPQSWQPRVLTPDQVELLATIAEHILPETDTPGARAVGVHRFIDALLAEAYGPEAQQRFVAGLADVDTRAQGRYGRAFLACAATEQYAILEQLDRETFSDAADGHTARFFQTLKELVLVGYYTSEVGATQELRYAAVPGRFEGCVPFDQVGRTWAV